MPKYRKKIDIEAVQWFKDGDHHAVKVSLGDATLRTSRFGTNFVLKGDYIVTDFDKGYYVVPKDDFEVMYELVVDTEQTP
jgi:hypothetical protein